VVGDPEVVIYGRRNSTMQGRLVVKFDGFSEFEMTPERIIGLYRSSASVML
jgi:hypothetical protein